MGVKVEVVVEIEKNAFQTIIQILIAMKFNLRRKKSAGNLCNIIFSTWYGIREKFLTDEAEIKQVNTRQYDVRV